MPRPGEYQSQAPSTGGYQSQAPLPAPSSPPSYSPGQFQSQQPSTGGYQSQQPSTSSGGGGRQQNRDATYYAEQEQRERDRAAAEARNSSNQSSTQSNNQYQTPLPPPQYQTPLPPVSPPPSGQLQTPAPTSITSAPNFGSQIVPVTVQAPSATSSPVLSVSPLISYAAESAAQRVVGGLSGGAPITTYQEVPGGYVVQIRKDAQINQNYLDAFENQIKLAKQFYPDAQFKKLGNRSYFVSEKPGATNNLSVLGDFSQRASEYVKPPTRSELLKQQFLASGREGRNFYEEARQQNIARDVPFLGELSTQLTQGANQLQYNIALNAREKQQRGVDLNPFGYISESSKILGLSGSDRGYQQGAGLNVAAPAATAFASGYAAGELLATGSLAVAAGSAKPLFSLGGSYLKTTGAGLGFQTLLESPRIASDVVSGKPTETLGQIFSPSNVASVAVLSRQFEPLKGQGQGLSVGQQIERQAERITSNKIGQSIISGAATGGIFSAEATTLQSGDNKPILESFLLGSALGGGIGGGARALGEFRINRQVTKAVEQGKVEVTLGKADVKNPQAIYQLGQGSYLGESIQPGEVTIRTKAGTKTVPIETKSRIEYLDTPSGETYYAGALEAKVPTTKGKTKIVSTDVFGEISSRNVEGVNLLEGTYKAGDKTGAISGTSRQSFQTGTSSAETGFYEFNPSRKQYLERTVERGSKTGEEFIVSDIGGQSVFQPVKERYTFELTTEPYRRGTQTGLESVNQAAARAFELDIMSVANPKERISRLNEPINIKEFTGETKTSYTESLFVGNDKGLGSLIRKQGSDFGLYRQSTETRLPSGKSTVPDINKVRLTSEKRTYTDLGLKPTETKSTPSLEPTKSKTVELTETKTKTSQRTSPLETLFGESLEQTFKSEYRQELIGKRTAQLQNVRVQPFIQLSSTKQIVQPTFVQPSTNLFSPTLELSTIGLPSTVSSKKEAQARVEKTFEEGFSPKLPDSGGFNLFVPITKSSQDQSQPQKQDQPQVVTQPVKLNPFSPLPPTTPSSSYPSFNVGSSPNLGGLGFRFPGTGTPGPLTSSSIKKSPKGAVLDLLSITFGRGTKKRKR